MAAVIGRRSVLGLTVLGAGAAMAAGTGSAAAAGPGTADRIRRAYERETDRAGGNWYSMISIIDDAGATELVVLDEPDTPIFAYSVNKIWVAAAVLDKVDRGELTLDRTVTLTAEILSADGDGIYLLQPVQGDRLTLAGIICALLLVSDDTAVRLCGTVCPGPEVNAFLATRGAAQTRVIPLADNPNRFFLGPTTPRETHDLFGRLVDGTLLSAASTAFLLRVLRWKDGYHDGIRRSMSSAERLRVATKYGAFRDGRNEAGVMFDPAGAPVLRYAFFADGQPGADDFGATHPAVEARAKLGRVLFDEVFEMTNRTSPTRLPMQHIPSDGG
ncbi:MAG: serine hydrolase [Pseudonocardia sp.]